MGGGSGESERTIRYAPYIESNHHGVINHAATTMFAVMNNSPFASYDEIEIDDAFFGVGYVISSFPSLYDMYGKFMAGLDVEGLFNQILDDVVDGPIINNVISAEATSLSDDIENEATPRFVTGMRDINSVLSSTFIVGRAMMETARTKAISKFSADLRYRMVPVAADRWKTHLEWNKGVVMSYAEIMKLFISAKMDVDNHNLSIASKDLMWPFNAIEQVRLAVGTLTGAQDIKDNVKGASDTQKAIGGALSGAAAGAMLGAPTGIGAPFGAVIGGVLGLAGGLID